MLANNIQEYKSKSTFNISVSQSCFFERQEDVQYLAAKLTLLKSEEARSGKVFKED